MRRKDRMITGEEALEILYSGEYGILSTVTEDCLPYGVPLNYCMINGSIYFHCAPEGRKLDNLKSNPEVSFSVVGKTEVLPDLFATNFESCIVSGTADEVFADEKQLALEGLVKKYSRDYMEEGLEFIRKNLERIRVFRISVRSISGKARR